MDEYIVDVEMDNERTTIKTFARTVENAIDNIVQLPSVQKLFNIGNTNTKEIWEFEEDIEELKNSGKNYHQTLKCFLVLGKTNGNNINMYSCSKHGSFSDSVRLLSRK